MCSTRLDEIWSRQDKTKYNTNYPLRLLFCWPKSWFDDNGESCWHHHHHDDEGKGKRDVSLVIIRTKNNLRGRERKTKRHFLLDFQKKCLPTPKCIPSVVQSLTPPASQPLSLSFFLCQMYLREDRNLFAPFFTTIYQHRSINQAQREKERGGGRKEEERGGRSVTHLPTSLIWHISTTSSGKKKKKKKPTQIVIVVVVPDWLDSAWLGSQLS